MAFSPRKTRWYYVLSLEPSTYLYVRSTGNVSAGSTEHPLSHPVCVRGWLTYVLTKHIKATIITEWHPPLAIDEYIYTSIRYKKLNHATDINRPWTRLWKGLVGDKTVNSNLLLLLLPLPIYKDAFETCSRSFTNVYAYFTGDVLELIQWYVPLLLSPLPILLARLWNIQQYVPLLLFLPIFPWGVCGTYNSTFLYYYLTS